MHVLIIPSWYPSHQGDISGSFFREQALALRKSGCKVGVIYPQLRSLRQWRSVFKGRFGLEGKSDEGIVTLRYHGMNWYPRIKELFKRAWCRKGVKLFNEYVKLNGMPDIIHAHSIFNAGILAKEISKKNHIPFIVTEHSTGYARNLISKKNMKVAEKVCNAASANLAVSDEFCALLSLKLQTNKKWIYVPNMVSEFFFQSKLESRIDKKFFFINIALATKKKNQKNIILAFNNEFNGEDSVKLVIGGDGPELEALKELVNGLQISNQVEFTGALSREQVRKKMAASDAFVLSSRHETFGVVVIEALALGLPVIATRCGGPESIVREEDGILVSVDDVEELGKAMREMCVNSAKYDKNKIQESCRERFSENVIAEKLVNIYKGVIADIQPHES